MPKALSSLRPSERRAVAAGGVAAAAAAAAKARPPAARRGVSGGGGDGGIFSDDDDDDDDDDDAAAEKAEEEGGGVGSPLAARARAIDETDHAAVVPAYRRLLLSAILPALEKKLGSAPGAGASPEAAFSALLSGVPEPAALLLKITKELMTDFAEKSASGRPSSKLELLQATMRWVCEKVGVANPYDDGRQLGQFKQKLIQKLLAEGRTMARQHAPYASDADWLAVISLMVDAAPAALRADGTKRPPGGLSHRDRGTASTSLAMWAAVTLARYSGIRGDNLLSQCVSNLAVVDDLYHPFGASLVMFQPQSKADPYGEGAGRYIPIYPLMKNAHLCPLLSVCVWLLANNDLYSDLHFFAHAGLLHTAPSIRGRLGCCLLQQHPFSAAKRCVFARLQLARALCCAATMPGG